MATATARGGFDFRTEPPLKEFQFRVSRFADGISDFSTLFPALAELFKREMGEQFETEGRVSGARWKAVDEKYAKRKKASGHGSKIGVYHGYLRSAMTGGGGWTEQITSVTAKFGMSDDALAEPYGAHFAALRPIVRMTARWGRDWQKAVHVWLVMESRNITGGAPVAGMVRGGGVTGSVPSGSIKSALAGVL